MEHYENQISGSLSLCISGCGFYGHPKTLGLCSKCYKDNPQRNNVNLVSSKLSGETATGASWSSASGPMDCKECNEVFSGIDSFRHHQASERHKKKVLQINSNAPRAEGFTRMENINIILCAPCSKTFSNRLEFQYHCFTGEHALAVLKLNEVPLDKERPSYDSTSSSYKKESSLPNKESISSFNTNYSRCEICNKQFSGPEPYQEHINSIKHKKKAQMLLNSSGEVKLPTDKGPLSCPTCDKYFTGPECYEQHMRSEKHQKKMLSAATLKGDKMQLESQTCNKMFSGPLNYDQHLKRELHKEKVDMQHANQEKENSTGQESRNNDGNISYRNWYCNTCDIQCSGPAPFKQHNESIAHAKHVMRAAADEKKRYLRNLISGDAHDDPDGFSRQEVASPPALDPNKSNIYGSPADSSEEIGESDVREGLAAVVPATLNIHFFGVDEEIDFDKIGNNNFNDNLMDMSYGDKDPEEDSTEMDDAPSP